MTRPCQPELPPVRAVFMLVLAMAASVAGRCPDYIGRPNTCHILPRLDDTLRSGIGLPPMNEHNTTLAGLTAYLADLKLTEGEQAEAELRKHKKEISDAFYGYDVSI